MKSASEVLGNIAFRTEVRHCEKHGEYSCELMKVGQRWIESHCPTCQEAKDAKREQVERDERIAARRRYLITRIGVPRRFEGATLANYQPTIERADKVLAACRRYVETWPERYEKGSSLILSGSVGTGKTHLACAVAKAVAAKHEAHVAYMTVMQAVRRIRATYGPDARETEQEAFDLLSNLDLLILDEVGIQSGSNHEHTTLFEIINRRYENVLPTIVVSNLGLKELSEAIGERLVDRLREQGAVLTFTWDSYRGGSVKWTRYSGDTITADGYTISRYVLGEIYYYTARDPDWQRLLSYWGENAERAKAACKAHLEGHRRPQVIEAGAVKQTPGGG